jgi:hypothetical protein
MNFDQLESTIMEESYNLGFTIYGINKQAASGSREAQEYLKKAMDAAMAAAPEAGMEAPVAPATIFCPQHQGETVPTPEGICPVCGYDFNTMAGEVAPEAGIPAPTEEDVAAMGEQIKAAAINDKEVMRWLMVNFGDWNEQ